ncbi:MAG: hypothetical protein KC620_12810 [Myxococcales bacterium]|nr:hypothetical protein [Myxococcales bacterium]
MTASLARTALLVAGLLALGGCQTHPGLTGLVRPDGTGTKQFGCIFTEQTGTMWVERFALNDATEREIFIKGPDITMTEDGYAVAQCEKTIEPSAALAHTAYLEALKKEGGAPYTGQFSFRYDAMPSSKQIGELPATPDGASVLVFRVKNQSKGGALDRGWLLRIRRNVSRATTQVTEHWILHKDYEGPTSGTTTLLDREANPSWSDAKAFLTALKADATLTMWVHGDYELTPY